MSRENRAKQFLPFNSLRGYYDLIKEAELIKEPRRELAEEELEILAYKFKQVKKGMLVKITFYKDYGYTTLEGMVAKLDEIYRTITIVKKVISLDDIIDVEGNDIIIKPF